MTPVKSAPRFRCEFCNRVATKAAMIAHERRCFFNPNRKCKECNDTGLVFAFESRGFEPCRYCAKTIEVLQSREEFEGISDELGLNLRRLMAQQAKEATS